MKTSILQSVLARNKEVINELTYNQGVLKDSLRLTNMEISDLYLTENSMYLKACRAKKNRILKDIRKNSKSLKQLAAIQKEIKEEIKYTDKSNYIFIKSGDILDLIENGKFDEAESIIVSLENKYGKTEIEAQKLKILLKKFKIKKGLI